MHYVWSRWPAWSGLSCDRLRCAAMHCAVPGSTSPTLSGISPAAIIAYFSGTCKPRRRFPPPFSATFRLSLPQPYWPFCRWPMPPISVGGFRQPSSQRRRPSVAGSRCCFRRQIPAAFAVARLGFSQVSSLRAFIKNRRRDFHRFPWGNEGAMEAARRRLPHFWGACAFYLLSMVSLHTKTSFLTKPHGSKLSLSSFCGLSHGTGQPLPVVCGSD